MNYYLDNRNSLLKFSILKSSDVALNLEKLLTQERLYLLEQSESQNKVEGWVYGDAELLEFYCIVHKEDPNEEVETLKDKLRLLRANVNKIHYKKIKRIKQLRRQLEFISMLHKI